MIVQMFEAVVVVVVIGKLFRSAQSDWTVVVKVNRRKMRPYHILF
jgi:hypothetical protein